MKYYIEMSLEWRGEVEAHDEEDALEIADTFFSQQDVATSITLLAED